MTQERRKLMLTVIDENSQVVRHMYLLSGYVRCDEILTWLVSNKFIGERFNEFLKNQFEGSVLDMCVYILSKINRERKEKILYGLDFI